MDVTSLIKMLVCSQILFLLGSCPRWSSAPSKRTRCWIQLCAALRLLAGRVGMCCISCLLRRLALARRGFWRHLRGGGAQMQLCHAVVKRVWRWLPGGTGWTTSHVLSISDREGLDSVRAWGANISLFCSSKEASGREYADTVPVQPLALMCLTA